MINIDFIFGIIFGFIAGIIVACVAINYLLKNIKF